MSERFDAQAAALRLLGETDDVQLSSLTREELRGVGDDPLLANAADTLWWEALGEREQELVLETAQRGLLARNLLEPSGEAGLRATEEVRVVLAARTAPDWIMVLGEPGAPRDSDGAPSQISLLALPTASGSASQRPPAHSETPPGAVLVTGRLEGIYLHRLVAGETVYAVAADWLLRPHEDGDEDAGKDAGKDAGEDAGEAASGRTVELLLPGEAGLTSIRALVLQSQGAAFLSVVRDGEPTEPEATDVTSLASWLGERVRTRTS